MTAMQTAPTPHPAAAIDWDALDALKYQDEDTAVAKLLAALGAWLGWQALPIVLLLSSLAGAIIGMAESLWIRIGWS